MKHILAIIVLSATATATAIASASSLTNDTVSRPKLSDTQMASLLIGRWNYDTTNASVFVIATRTLRSNGTFRVSSLFSPAYECPFIFDYEGTWEVKDSVLIEKVENTSMPQFAPVGSVSREQVVSVDRDRFAFESDGEVIVRFRMRQDHAMDGETITGELYPTLNNWPPRFDSGQHHCDILHKWQEARENLEQRVATENSYDIHCWLGDVYRLGYNLDIAAAGSNAILHLERAAQIDPTRLDATFLLAAYYTDGPDPAEGERILRDLLKKTTGEDHAKTLRWLCHNLSIQEKYEQAEEFGNLYLKTHPDDDWIRDMCSRAKEALRGNPPKIVNLAEPTGPPYAVPEAAAGTIIRSWSGVAPGKP